MHVWNTLKNYLAVGLADLQRLSIHFLYLFSTLLCTLLFGYFETCYKQSFHFLSYVSHPPMLFWKDEHALALGVLWVFQYCFIAMSSVKIVAQNIDYVLDIRNFLVLNKTLLLWCSEMQFMLVCTWHWKQSGSPQMRFKDLCPSTFAHRLENQWKKKRKRTK